MQLYLLQYVYLSLQLMWSLYCLYISVFSILVRFYSVIKVLFNFPRLALQTSLTGKGKLTSGEININLVRRTITQFSFSQSCDGHTHGSKTPVIYIMLLTCANGVTIMSSPCLQTQIDSWKSCLKGKYYAIPMTWKHKHTNTDKKILLFFFVFMYMNAQVGCTPWWVANITLDINTVQYIVLVIQIYSQRQRCRLKFSEQSHTTPASYMANNTEAWWKRQEIRQTPKLVTGKVTHQTTNRIISI